MTVLQGQWSFKFQAWLNSAFLAGTCKQDFLIKALWRTKPIVQVKRFQIVLRLLTTQIVAEIQSVCSWKAQRWSIRAKGCSRNESFSESLQMNGKFICCWWAAIRNGKWSLLKWGKWDCYLMNNAVEGNFKAWSDSADKLSWIINLCWWRKALTNLNFAAFVIMT